MEDDLGPTASQLADMTLVPEAPFDPYRVTPGSLDKRILDQTQLWVDGHAAVHRVDDMGHAYRANVVAHLHLHADWMWSANVIEELLSNPVELHAAQRAAEIRLVGESNPHTWLESTPLVRELRRLTPGIAHAPVLVAWAQDVRARSARAGAEIWQVPGSVVPLPQDPGRNWAEDMRQNPAYDEPDEQPAGGGAEEGGRP